jgi:hypothetical protein
MRSIIICVICLVAAPVSRAEMLLVTIYHGTHVFDASQSGNFLFQTAVHEPPFSGMPGELRQIRSPADIGLTFDMAADQVALMNLHFRHPNAQLLIAEMSPAGNAVGTADDIWSGFLEPEFDFSGNAAIVTTHVPRRGVGLTGYNLTRITQTIDEFSLVQQGRYYIADLAQTIRIYGDVIPEPSSWMLVTVAGFAWLLCRRKTSNPTN